MPPKKEPLDASKLSAFTALSEEEQQKILVDLSQESPRSAINKLRLLTSDQRSVQLNRMSADTLRCFLTVLLPAKKKKWPQRGISLPWSSIRSLGNFPLFKISYVALLILPWVSRIAEYLQSGGYTYIGALYFGDLFLALANLVYDIRCPAVVKRWESPNDFYIQMLEVTAKQQQCYPGDDWIGNLEHSKSAYLKLAYARPVARVLCCFLYLLGLVLLVYVLGERSWHVLHPILSGRTKCC